MFRAPRLSLVLFLATLVFVTGCALSPSFASPVHAASQTSQPAPTVYRAPSLSASALAPPLAWQSAWPASWADFATAGPKGVVVTAPDIAENGALVPVGVATYNRAGPRPRMTAVTLYTCDRLRPVARYTYPRGVLSMRVRIKLRRTSTIIAIATLDDGTVVRAIKKSKVTWGGCGGGGGEDPEPAVTPAPAPPEAAYWQRSTLPVNTARLTAENVALPIESYRADVRIEGFRARVVLDIVFRNTSSWDRQGRFQLRLPARAAPYYVAFGDTVLYDDDPDPLSVTLTDAVGLPAANLDFERAPSNDTLREAVMVDRARASTAYWRTVYRKIDPALVEWHGSGIFSLNVFPLRPGQTHRIVLAYDVDLEPVATGQRRYRLVAPADVKDAQIYVHLHAASAAALIDAPAAVAVVDVGDYRVQVYHPAQGEALTFSFAAPAGSYLFRHGTDTGDYLAAQVPLNLPPLGASVASETAVFAIDTSLSSRPEHFNEYVALTEAILAQNSDRIRRFAVLFFDVGTHWWQPLFIDNTEANRRALRDALQQVSLLGASDLSRALREVAAPVDLATDGIAQWDVFLLSDGRDNWGDPTLDPLQALFADSPVQHLNVYTAQPRDHLAHLRTLVEATDGAIFVLSHPRQVQAAARAHRQRAWRLEGITAPGLTDVLVSGAEGDLLPNQMLRVAARGRPGGELRFRFRAGERRIEVRHRLGKGIDSELAPRIFGEMAVPWLEDTRKDRHTAQFFAGYFRIPRATMSLLMLESDADYRRFGINRFRKFAAGVRRARLGRVVLRAPEPARRAPARGREDFDHTGIFARPGVGMFIPCDAWPAIFLLLHDRNWQPRAVRHSPLFLPETALRPVMLAGIRLLDGEQSAREFLHRAAGLHADDGYLALRMLSSGVEVHPDDYATQQAVVEELLARDFVDDAWWLAYRQLLRADHGEETYRSYILMAQVLAVQDLQDEAVLFYELALAFGDIRDAFDRRILYRYRDLLRKRIERGGDVDTARARLDFIERYLARM